MKIALLGYGKMGKTIEKIALDRGHEIVLTIDKDSGEYDITKADVAIEFSTPQTAFENIKNAVENQVPIVAGTTGWLDKYKDIKHLTEEKNSAFLYASNFSVGVNIFFELNKTLARLMSKLKEYKVSIEEIHHTQKLDAPSGTAITLAEGIISETNKTGWQLDKASDDEIPIVVKRIDSIPGTHTIAYDSEIDSIEIKHTAHSRQGFALGAVLAAEWIVDKKGVFSMNDVLDIN